jgi:hypothetical protein
MKIRLAVLALVAALTGALVFATAGTAAPAAAAPSATAVPIPIVGTLPGGGAFNGTFNLQQIANQNGQLVAIGTLSGTLTDALGNVIGTIQDVLVTLPLQVTGTCQVLHLDIGPIDLNLLGLNVHLSEVVLDITATAGPGNLLGNLVCAVAHLLDNPSATLGAITNLLNQILARL